MLKVGQGLMGVNKFKHLQRKSRPWIAMIAAYAVALQMLLGGAAASQMAATAPSSSFPICYGAAPSADGQGQSDQAPIHQAPCVLCTIGLSAPVDQPPYDVTPAYFGKRIVLQGLAVAAFLPTAPPTPKLSQGPPQIV